MPTGEAVKRYSPDLAVDERLPLWLSDGAHFARLTPVGISLIAEAADSDEVRLALNV